MDEDENRRTCPRCNALLSVIRPAHPPHYAELWCDACGRHCGWASTPTEALGGYTMPFGKYRGKTLDEIAATDRGYLEWVTSDLKDERIKKSVRRYLEYKLQESKH
jgi:exodeoxyribonuclease X-like protein